VRLTTHEQPAAAPDRDSLIEHGTVGCTEDDEAEGCRGRELRHEGDPVCCWVWTLAGCNYCGVH
jgi:hypothetical protein